jgi:hypothetical protein
MDLLRELLSLKESMLKEDTVDNILEPLTKAFHKLNNSKSYSADFKEELKDIYDILRRPLMQGDLEEFHKKYDYVLGEYPDRADELFDQMFLAAGLGHHATIEDFYKKIED